MKWFSFPPRLMAAAASACLFAVAACAQDGGGAQRGAPAAVAADSVLPRAQRARYKGAENAPVTLVEVSDFQCPYCRQFVETTYPKLDSAYIRTGKVRMLFINLPLANHHQAFAAAEAAMCAGAQGHFWPMHDRLFAAQREWSGSATAATVFERLAGEVELDMAAYRDCTANDRTASIIVGDAMEASAGGVNGTPSFFMAGPGGRQPLAGAVTWEALQPAIEAMLVPAPAPQP